MESSLTQNLAAFASAAAGALLVLTLGVSHKQLCAMISFAAGALLAVTCFHLLPEAWGHVPAWEIALALFSGYAVFYLISRYVFHLCPACAASHFEEQSSAKLKSLFIPLVIALTVHNIMDGIALTLGKHLESGHEHSIFYTLTAHKFPEGLALCALLIRSGKKKAAAFLWTLVLESTMFVGWFAGETFLSEMRDLEWIHLVLLHIGGGFVFLSFHATLNEMEEHSPRFIFLFFMAGFILMGLIR